MGWLGGILNERGFNHRFSASFGGRFPGQLSIPNGGGLNQLLGRSFGSVDGRVRWSGISALLIVCVGVKGSSDFEVEFRLDCYPL